MCISSLGLKICEEQSNRIRQMYVVTNNCEQILCALLLYKWKLIKHSGFKFWGIVENYNQSKKLSAQVSLREKRNIDRPKKKHPKSLARSFNMKTLPLFTSSLAIEIYKTNAQAFWGRITDSVSAAQQIRALHQ